MKVVLDASVILKTVLPDEKPEEVELALDLFQKYTDQKIEIFVPSFWVYEIGNTLSIKLSKDKAVLGFKFLLAQDLKTFYFTKKQLLEIVEFSSSHKVSFYDAAYHLLAYFTDSVFITADKKYFQKFKSDKYLALLQKLKLN